jgi:hypothetical protein
MATFPPSEDAGFANENPYAPPSASLAGAEPLDTDSDLAKAESIRRTFLSHEASVRSVGSLHYLTAFFTGIVTIVGIVQSATEGNRATLAVNVGVTVFYAAMTILHVALGIGLNRLQPWARWTDVVFDSLALALCLLASITLLLLSVGQGVGILLPLLFGYGFVSLIFAYVLYLLLSRKSSMVFSPEYRAIIERTPYIKYRTSLLVKILLGLLASIILLLILGFFFVPRR